MGHIGDFPARAVTVVDVGGRELGIVRWNEQLYAVLNRCPHAQAPVCKGVLGPKLISGAVGEMVCDDSSAVLVCPWHRYEFDLGSGAARQHRHRYRLKQFAIRVENDRVLVQAPRAREGER